VKAAHVQLHSALTLAALLPFRFVGNVLDELIVYVLGAQAVVLRILAACACLLLARCARADAGADVLGGNEMAALCDSAKDGVGSVDLGLLGFVLSRNLV
jgi:hypothetical protein